MVGGWWLVVGGARLRAVLRPHFTAPRVPWVPSIPSFPSIPPPLPRYAVATIHRGDGDCKTTQNRAPLHHAYVHDTASRGHLVSHERVLVQSLLPVGRKQQWADPVTGSSLTPAPGAKKRDTKSTPGDAAAGHDHAAGLDFPKCREIRCE